MKTYNCSDCNNYQATSRLDEMACKEGHKPRFYNPKSNPYDPDWGWKRKCEDFTERENTK